MRLNTLDWLGGQGGSRQITSGMTRLTGWETGAVRAASGDLVNHAGCRTLTGSLPRLCSAERLSESMVDEIFQRGLHEYRNENGAGAVRWRGGGAYQAGVVKALAECGTQISRFQGPALAHSMVPLSRPLPIVRSCRTPGGALGSSGE